MIEEKYKSAIDNLIGFFNKNAYDNNLKTYFSEIDNEGNKVSDKIYTVALSRLIYALAYTSEFYPENIEKAKNVANFQLTNMIGEDKVGKYFIANIDGHNKDNSKVLDIWQQAYGLCGLSELYRKTKDKNLLKNIHNLHDAFINRFTDITYGGFYGEYHIENGQVSGSKSLQSLMYPITAYIANLWLADEENRSKYEPTIIENLKIIDKVGWNEKATWVNVKFDDIWNVCAHKSDSDLAFTVVPGHNFQLASLYLRTKTWSFLSDRVREEYQAKGKDIIDKTLNNKLISDNLTKGFCNEVNPVTNQALSLQKDWWQHCEAVLALSMLQPKYKNEMEAIEDYFFAYFTDTNNGGEYFKLNEDNSPVTTELKGSIGKSSYHTIEMIRFIIENS